MLDVVLSSAWVSTEYNSQNASETFNVWGDAEVFEWAHSYNGVDYGSIVEILGKGLASIRKVSGV